MIRIVMSSYGLEPGIAKRELNNVLKAAFGIIGEYWHRICLPRHFTHEGAKAYGYTPRKGERGSDSTSKLFRRTYTGRKLKTKGHTLPLVWSGVSRARALVRAGAIRATSNGVKVAIMAPALNFKNPHSKVVPREEVTRITEEETKALMRMFHGRVEAGIKALKASKTKVIAA